MIIALHDMTIAMIHHDTEIETVEVTGEIEIETVKNDTTKTPLIIEVPTVTADEIILLPEEITVPVEVITALPVEESIQVGVITLQVVEVEVEVQKSIPPQETIETIAMIIEGEVQIDLMDIEVEEGVLGEVDMEEEIVNEVFLPKDHVVQLQI
jgi:hypothetical protein